MTSVATAAIILEATQLWDNSKKEMFYSLHDSNLFHGFLMFSPAEKVIFDIIAWQKTRKILRTKALTFS